jgi:phage FluMu protein Com
LKGDVVLVKGYCGNCNENFEFYYNSTYLVEADDGSLYINIKCPRCDDYDEVEATVNGESKKSW